MKNAWVNCKPEVFLLLQEPVYCSPNELKKRSTSWNFNELGREEGPIPWNVQIAQAVLPRVFTIIRSLTTSFHRRG
jgi:hypothetical protein